jgi:hypothetical protein
MKTFREYLEGKEVNESFLRNAALAGATALGMMGIGGQARAETPTTPNQIPVLVNRDMPSFRARMKDKTPPMTAKQLEAMMDQLNADQKAREDKMTPHEKLMARVRKAREERGETPKIDINKLNKYVGEDTPYKDTFEKLKRFYQKVPDDGQRDPRAPRPDPEVEKIMKEVEAQKAKEAEEKRAKFLKSMKDAERFAR